MSEPCGLRLARMVIVAVGATMAGGGRSLRAIGELAAGVVPLICTSVAPAVRARSAA
jgi:hypothetical protein